MKWEREYCIVVIRYFGLCGEKYLPGFGKAQRYYNIFPQQIMMKGRCSLLSVRLQVQCILLLQIYQ